jgi:acetyl esterase/lipase
MPRVRPVLMLTWLLSACSGTGMLNAVAPSRGIAVSEGVPYADGERHKLDIYRPAADGAPVVVFLYGGGWRAGDRGMYRFAGAALADRGFLVAIPDYRVFPEAAFPGFVEDAAAAVAWTKAHAAEYGGDPRRVFLMGHSAGAHIAAMLTLDKSFLARVGLDPDRDVAGTVGLAGPYDFLPLNDPNLDPIFAPAGDLALTQPITFARTGAPPMLLLTGDADRVVYPRNAMHLAARVTALGGRAEVRQYSGVGHSSIVGALSGVLAWKAPILADSLAFMHAEAAR